MRFVPVKSEDTQALLLTHKAREFLVRQQTQIVNAMRAHLGEFGIVVPKGIQNVDRLQAAAGNVPEAARSVLELLAAQLRDTCARIVDVTKRIEAAQAEDALAPRLATLPGIGALTASALAATTPEVDAFRSARDYAAWLGLKPKPQSTGGKERLGVRSGRSPSPIGPGPMAPRWTTVRGLTDELRDRLEVEAVQALGGREFRSLDAPLDHSPLTVDQLQLDQAREELDVIQPFSRILAGELVVFPEEGRQLQGLQVMREQDLRGLGHAAFPDSRDM